MIRRLHPYLNAILLLLNAACSATAETVYIPLEKSTLVGADIFDTAHACVMQASQSAQLVFISDPRPLPPQIILNLDTAEGAVQKRNGLLFWRGDMLPDQLAPAETGTLIRKRHEPNGQWKTIRIRGDVSPSAHSNLVPVVHRTAQGILPPMLIETVFQLGSLDGLPVSLVLWRTEEEGSAPVGGAIALPHPSAALLDSLKAVLPPFAGQDGWAAEFDAFSP